MKTSPMLVVSADDHVFLLNDALPMAESRAQVAAVLVYATGLEVDAPKPDGSLLVFAATPRVERELGTWVEVSNVLERVAASSFDEESGSAIVKFVAERTLSEE